MREIYLNSRLTGKIKRVICGDTVYDALDKKNYRIKNIESDGFVELMHDWDGKALPDLRHQAHLSCY